MPFDIAKFILVFGIGVGVAVVVGIVLESFLKKNLLETELVVNVSNG